MKKVLILVVILAIGAALWRFSGNVPISVWVAVIAFIGAAVGYELTVNPPTTSKGKWGYRITFFSLGVGIVVLTWVQSAVDEKEKSAINTAHSNQMDRLQISHSNQLFGIRKAFDDYRIANERPIPKLPQIKIETFPGLPAGMTKNPHLRYHCLKIRNANEVPIDNFCSRLQLPEPIYTTIETNLPPGTVISWRPLVTRVAISGTGTRSLLGPASVAHYLHTSPCFFPHGNRAQLSGFSEGSDITGVWELTIDKLRPGGLASLFFLTVNEGDATNYITLANTQFQTNGASIWTTVSGTTNGEVKLHNTTLAFIVNTTSVIDPNEDWHLGTNELRFSLEGLYQYEAAGRPGTQHFLVPFTFDTEQRVISSLPIQADDGEWKRVMIEFQ